VKFNFIGNKNIAFSLPVTGYGLNFIVAAVVLSLLVYAVYLWQKKQAVELLCLTAMILGASSNLYDRFVYGFVIDYIDVTFFTLFNLADALVVVGVGVLMWLTIREPQAE
jgi:signal peptidase II